jgi:hypothetical protein
VIAATVKSDPVTYNEAFLGKLNEEYVQWILNPEKWGGAIELSILCDHYAREIAAYDIQTMRCDLYGQVKECVTSVFFHFIICTTAFNLVMQSYLFVLRCPHVETEML